MIITSKSEEYKNNKVIYEQKFKRWDNIKNSLLTNNQKNNGDTNVKPELLFANKEAKEMLKDITIFAYAFFKDDAGNPIKLTNYQDLIGNANHDFTAEGKNRFKIFKASNQIGKSMLLDMMAIRNLILGTNENTIMVSKSLPQSQFLLASIRLLLNRSVFANTWKEDLGETANTTVLTMQRNNGKVVNRIICAPAGEGLLGYPVHHLYLDEADFYENAKTFFWKIAFPRTNATKGEIVLFSNPNPEIARSDSLLYELWLGELFNNKYTFNFLDAPWNTEKEFERDKKNSPSYIFESTHLGEFPQTGGSFFKQSELDRNIRKDWDNKLPIVDKPIYIALDLAKTTDRTALVIGTSSYVKDEITHNNISFIEARYIEYFENKIDYKDIVKRLKEIIDYYETYYKGVAGIGFDSTGVGRAVQEMLEEQNISATDISWSFEKKTKLYADFKLMMENDRIKIVYTDDCYRQMANLEFTRTPKGYYSVNASKQSIHDDIPDALAMLINISIKPDYVTPGVTFIDSTKEEKKKYYKEYEEDKKKNKNEIITEWSDELSEEDLNDILEVKRLQGGMRI